MHRSSPTIEQLRVVPGLAHESEKSLAKLAPLVSEVRAEPGSLLTREGAHGVEAFIVLDGEATVQVDGRSVASVGPGAFIGEMALLDNQPRSATVYARTPMRLLCIGPREFNEFVSHPAVSRAVARQLTARLRAL